LDVGCGQNNAVKDYRKRGGEGTGIDVYDFGGADRIVQDTSKLDYPDGAFDTISFIACLNHIPNRADALKEAFRLLSPGGRVVITMIPPRLSAVWHLLIRPWDEDQTDRGMKEGEVCGLTPDEIADCLSEAVLSSKHTAGLFLASIICSLRPKNRIRARQLQAVRFLLRTSRSCAIVAAQDGGKRKDSVPFRSVICPSDGRQELQDRNEAAHS